MCRVILFLGLDPAEPLFKDAPNNFRLDASDAEFVDIIHTCGGVLGYRASVGTADFFPNGGTPSQPGCRGFAALIGNTISNALGHLQLLHPGLKDLDPGI